MEITKTVLEAKLAGYEGTIKQLQAETIANQGAAAAIRALLKTLDEQEKPAEEKQPTEQEAKR